MTAPFYTDDWLTLYGGDCKTVLASLPADSVDCVVTSPPYWGLRDYGNDGQLGLERTPEEYVANMVAVFAEVRRVLKPSGTCWLNLGDSYAHNTETHPTQRGTNPKMATSARAREVEGTGVAKARGAGLKPKDLVGIPWRVAFALQADGWYLRSDIIWSKPNPMPESVTDRPTKSHEYLFLLTKSARYYFDSAAVRESVADATLDRLAQNVAEQNGSARANGGAKLNGPMRAVGTSAGRNLRSVWTIATQPYKGSHFAVFPPELPERCIKAGSSQKGVCPECGAPWERVTSRLAVPADVGETNGRYSNDPSILSASSRGIGKSRQYYRSLGMEGPPPPETTGWSPTCEHGERNESLGEAGHPHPSGRHNPTVVQRHAGGDRGGSSVHAATRDWTARADTPISAPAVPSVILDPFGGSGTVGMVANRLSRRAILIDLNPEYLKQQMKRNAQTPLGLDAA